ncbi:hypothetical protein [Corynebacterium sp. SA-MJD20WY100]|uniref:hypothetical protein n=1 Tax=Corynebacterium sp. SA-MJD20WY100 TaxID=3142969 RepID=UPI003221988E
MFFMVWILFLIAGLLAGGAWAAYQNGSKFWTIIASFLAAIAFAASVAWMIPQMHG